MFTPLPVFIYAHYYILYKLITGGDTFIINGGNDMMSVPIICVYPQPNNMSLF